MSPGKTELLSIVRAMSERGVREIIGLARHILNRERGDAAMRELAAFKAAQPKPRKSRPIKLTGNVVALRPDQGAQP